MNRQLRRAQAKLDRKAEIEKERRKAARRERVEELRERRRRQREEARQRVGSGAPATTNERRQYTPEERKRLPGRFSGAFMFATVFFIALQAAVPVEDKTVGNSLIGAGFFLMYGYFATLFLSRRGLPRAMVTAAVGGTTLAVVLGVMQAVQGQQVDYLMCGVGAVAAPVGAYLGRAVFNAAPRP
ncbi:MAG TPA: hypothetical protein VFF08_06215 [Trueperaceae bacterium]|nr:hypothetical protein [Trueperaceae bacterium]